MVPILALLIAATLATCVQGDAITGLLRNREESQVLREVRSHPSSMISRLTRPNARIGLECHVSPCLETPNGHMAPCRNGTCHQGGTVSTGAEGRGATGTFALKLATQVKRLAGNGHALLPVHYHDAIGRKGKIDWSDESYLVRRRWRCSAGGSGPLES